MRIRVLSGLLAVAVLALCGSMCAAAKKQDAAKTGDARLKAAYRFERGGWVYVHLEGSPSDIGYQHGYLLAPEIEDGFKTVQLLDIYRTQRDWNFYRATAQNVLWPHIEAEYREELQGIADGLKAHGSTMDVWDVVALNAMEEVPDYYVPTLNRQEKAQNAPDLKAPGNCSAFVATGSWTKDHKPVIAHSNWTEHRRRNALDHYLRHRSHARLSHADGRLSRHHRQRRRFRH